MLTPFLGVPLTRHNYDRFSVWTVNSGMISRFSHPVIEVVVVETERQQEMTTRPFRIRRDYIDVGSTGRTGASNDRTSAYQNLHWYTNSNAAESD